MSEWDAESSALGSVCKLINNPTEIRTPGPAFVLFKQCGM